MNLETETIALALDTAAAIARLDQALADHPLERAFLYRARLEAVRRQAAVDGQAIDPWHLAAILEGLRLRMDPLRIAERGAVFAAARHALDLHGWLTIPDPAQQAEIARAAATLEAASPVPILGAARGLRGWLDAGFSRAPARAALVDYWIRHNLLRCRVPLTGAVALRNPARDPEGWTKAFLAAVGEEAGEALALLQELERAWVSARVAVGGRRRHSRAAAAIDILAAAPLVSPTGLAAGLEMAPNNATALLVEFCRAGIAVEVSRRARGRLFGLAGLAPLREGVLAPRRPLPGRGRGRPRNMLDDRPSVAADGTPGSHTTPSLPGAGRLDVPTFDYAELDQWMAQTDTAIRHARAMLETETAGVRDHSTTEQHAPSR